MIDFPCTCGHSKEEHMAMFKNGCGYSRSGFYRDCTCNQYVPDNLKYLEMKYEEKINEARS